MRILLNHAALICILVGLTGCGGPTESTPAFEISLQGPQSEGDSIEVTGTAGDLLFTVRSEFGIGRATIRPSDGYWPAKVAFQFELEGLESFEASGQQIYRREHLDDHRSGGYRVELPNGVTGTLDQSIEVSWVDFYR